MHEDTKLNRHQLRWNPHQLRLFRPYKTWGILLVPIILANVTIKTKRRRRKIIDKQTNKFYRDQNNIYINYMDHKVI